MKIVYASVVLLAAAVSAVAAQNEPSSGESFLRSPGRRALTSIFEENPCSIFHPDTPEKSLCHQLRAYFRGDGDAFEADNDIRSIILEIYDSNVVRHVVEMAQVHDEVQNMGE